MLPLTLVVLAAAPTAAPAAPPLPEAAAVFIASPDEVQSAKREAALTRGLTEAQVTVISIDAAFPSTKGADGASEGLLKEARQLYDDLDYEASLEKWKALEEYFAAHPASASSNALADTHFFIGVLTLQNGGKKEAKKVQEQFAAALVHNPGLTCDPSTYGADAKKIFDKAVTEVNNRATAKLEISSTPAGATVELRGRSLGLTPVADHPTLPVGRHLVLLAKPGYERTGAFADVLKEGATVKPELKAAAGYGQARDRATALVGKHFGAKGPVPPEARGLAEKMKARFLVLSDGNTAEVWDVESGNRLAGVALSEDLLADSSQRIAAFMKNPAPVAVATKDKAAAAGPSGPIYTQWWFWTAVGVVVVGGATAGGVAAANSSPGRPFNVVLGLP